MNFSDLITKINQAQNLTASESEQIFSYLFEQNPAEHEIKTLLTAWYQKKESAEEIVGAVRYLKTKMQKLPTTLTALFDCCGTGGDGQGTFNISTTVAFILAACGVKVAKHGNRAMSSKSGSSDILAALGIPADVAPEISASCLKQNGIAFLFAPIYHPVLAKVRTVRQSLGHRTIFNLLGPLLNPADAKKQMVGVPEKNLVSIYAEAMKQLNYESAVIVHSDDGLDEFSLAANATLARLENNRIQLQSFNPTISGYSYCNPSDLKGADPEANAIRLKLCLKGHSEPLDHTVHINAAWGLIAAGHTTDFLDALLVVQDAISSGRAYQKLVDIQNFFANEKSQ